MSVVEVTAGEPMPSSANDGGDAHVVPGRGALAADESIVSTIHHDHRDRVPSRELPADEWARR